MPGSIFNVEALALLLRFMEVGKGGLSYLQMDNDRYDESYGATDEIRLGELGELQAELLKNEGVSDERRVAYTNLEHSTALV